MTKFPDFKSLEEEAQYWETHSIAPYWDNLQDAEFEVEIPYMGDLLIVPVDKNQIKKLMEMSKERGISFHELMKNMIGDYVAQRH